MAGAERGTSVERAPEDLSVGLWAVVTWFALGVGIVRAWATGRAGVPGDAA